MADQKALPVTPASLATLSVDARSHRSRLVRYFLSELPDPGIKNSVDDWAFAIDRSLDELGKCVAENDWLSEIRESRELRRKLKRQQARADKEAAAQETVKPKKLSKPSASLVSVASMSTTGKCVEESVLPQQDTPLKPISSRPDSIASKGRRKRLLICIAPLGSRILVAPPKNTSEPTHLRPICSFVAEQSSDEGTIVIGDNRGTDSDDASEILGGTFVLRGVNSFSQHQLLSGVLQISIYLHLSLVLEQHLFLDSNVYLFFQRPKMPPSLPSAPSQLIPERIIAPETKPRKYSSFLPSGLMSLFSPKSSMGHRSRTIMPIMGRAGSLDFGTDRPPLQQQLKHDGGSRRSSFEGGKGRLRRLSLIGERRPSIKQKEEPKPKPAEGPPFDSILHDLEENGELLSTSPGVRIPVPGLIVELAEKERKNPSRRLKGDERCGLSSLLGWEGKESRAKGMMGMQGFLRHQGFSMKLSRHIPSTSDAAPSSDNTSSSSIQLSNTFLYTSCGWPTHKSYCYYSDSDDSALGEKILNLVDKATEHCSEPGCQYTQGRHELRLAHNDIRIAVNIEEHSELRTDTSRADSIQIWESCLICRAASKRREMSDGTYLHSFGKFLELLIYSAKFCQPVAPLCEHTTPPPHPWPTLPASRLNIVRNFSTRTHTVSFALAAVQDVYELRVPKLQIVSGPYAPTGGPGTGTDVEDDRKLLRREIKRWWESISDHMDKLESIVGIDEMDVPLKPLPRLPSTDDAYDDPVAYSQGEPSECTTPCASSSASPKASSMVAPTDAHQGYQPRDGKTPTQHTVSLPAASLSFASQVSLTTPVQRLSNMRQTFHRTEQSLYAQVAKTPAASLNDARRSFLYAAKGAQKRLAAWEKKHIPPTPEEAISGDNTEPEWWAKGCHAVPGGNVIVREDDWGSIISYTLSTSDYHHELGGMSVVKMASEPTAQTQDSSTSGSKSSSFFFSGYKLFATTPVAQPDPDQEDVTWSEPEAFSSVISRKDYSRDSATLLSIREVLRQNPHKPAVDGVASPRYGSLNTSKPGISTLPSAWAKPEVQISMDAAGGQVSTMPDTVESAGKLLQELDSAKSHPNASSISSGASEAGGSEPPPEQPEQASSGMSSESDVTIGKGVESRERDSECAPGLSKNSQSQTGPDAVDEGRDAAETESRSQGSTSSFTNTLSSGFHNALRYVITAGEPPRPSSPSLKSQHGLLAADGNVIEERPHIKYDWTVGNRLKFSCTVYYAKQFDIMRKRCGIADIYVRSLSRSSNWSAEGGKSKSVFWKTWDERFIVKTLIDAWNVDDLQALVELAPSYFRYMEATTSKPTVLAKMMGFYTVEIRNLETGSVQSKADLVVMENVFYSQKVVKTFDLKGIHGRKVKASSRGKGSQIPRTLFDGEWIEGQQKAMVLVRPHSKHVLRAAVRSDSEFLAKSNIMDYSLLVGIDEENKQIACGLVDTIGSYTFAKTLEYKAKHGLNVGKEVTVVPPAEYQKRFVSALDGYFLACPDKWSKPADESSIINDPDKLPSVL